MSRQDEPINDAELARRLQRDIETMQRICDEKDAEIGLLRERLDQLLASRWRKLGQRLRLAMTMDWEKAKD